MDQSEFKDREEPTNRLFEVTPVSKYLAMALFVVLPFLGAWIGYTFAPVKTVEVERFVVKDEHHEQADEGGNVTTEETWPTGSTYAVHTFRDDAGWNGAWLMRHDEETDVFAPELQLTEGFVNFEGVIQDDHLYLYDQERIIVTDLAERTVASYDVGGYVQDILVASDSVFVQVNDDPTCADFPTSFDRCNGSLYAVDLVEKRAERIAEGLPGGKSLTAYTPGARVVIGDGYGDAGCVSRVFYEYDLTNGTTQEVYSDSFCSGDAGSDDGRTHDAFEADVAEFVNGLRSAGTYVQEDAPEYTQWTFDETEASGLVEYDDRGYSLAGGAMVVPVTIAD